MKHSTAQGFQIRGAKSPLKHQLLTDAGREEAENTETVFKNSVARAAVTLGRAQRHGGIGSELRNPPG